jgi:hypothetical protein
MTIADRAVLVTGANRGNGAENGEEDGRGLDGLWGMYQWLDRAPPGRNETGFWWRHDEYDSQWRELRTCSTSWGTGCTRRDSDALAFPFGVSYLLRGQRARSVSQSHDDCGLRGDNCRP